MASTAHALHILVKHQNQAEDIIQQLKKRREISNTREEVLHLSIR